MWEQHYPECLLRILLVRAGIETNPGPWFCSVCRNRIHHRSVSVRCNGCMEWVHFRNCSGLNRIQEYSDRDYIASCCVNVDPSESSSSASSSSSQYETPPQSPQQQSTQQLTPHIAVQVPDNSSFLQFNCDGLRGKINEIVSFMSRKNIKVAAIQETKLSTTCRLQSCDGYNVLRKDRSRGGGGGLAFLLHHSVQ